MSCPDDREVEVRYPLTAEQQAGDRGAWPWLPGTVVEQCGPDEWYVQVDAEELATVRDGERSCPACFRDASELRRPAAEPPEPGAGL